MWNTSTLPSSAIVTGATVRITRHGYALDDRNTEPVVGPNSLGTVFSIEQVTPTPTVGTLSGCLWVRLTPTPTLPDCLARHAARIGDLFQAYGQSTTTHNQ